MKIYGVDDLEESIDAIMIVDLVEQLWASPESRRVDHSLEPQCKGDGGRWRYTQNKVATCNYPAHLSNTYICTLYSLRSNSQIS
jgi:hypothetical protein